MKEETQGKRRLAEQESPPSLGYDWFFPCARTTTKKIIKKNSKWCSKNKDERGRGGIACWDVVLAVVLLLLFFFFFVP